jgi:hypothetical protein
MHRVSTAPTGRSPASLAAAAALLLLLLLAACLAPAARADLLDATCQGDVSSTFSPGLRLFDQSVAGRDSASFECVSASDPTVTGGSTHQSYTATQSCLNPVGNYPFSATITWSNGHSSIVSGTSVLTALAGQSVYTATGTVTAGQFAGDTFALVTTEPALDLLSCVFAPGITSRSGTATLTVT